MVEWMGYPLYYAFDGADPPARTGAAHATIYPYGPFQAGDGKVVMLGLQNEREWAVFCRDVLKQPELATDERFATNSKRSAARDALRAIIVEAFRPFTAAQVIERLDTAGIANARMNDMHEVRAHPQLAARKRWVDVETPAGKVPALRAAGVAAVATAADGPGPGARRADAVDPARARLCGGRDRAADRRGDHRMKANALSPTATLARFASQLAFDDIPPAVVRRAEDLLLDWLGSALAGKGARAVETIARFARQMGPSDGGSEVLITRGRTSPMFAALVNAAASHFAEQDDVHNGSVFHPATVVFPPALAVAQATDASGRDLPHRRGRRLRSRHSRR